MTVVLREVDVAIVGSGPYALSLAAQLRARDVEFRIFGPPMKFWRDMPVGINLKSFGFATNVYVPAAGHTFSEWCRSNRLEDHEPCTMASFARYGMWVTERFIPGIEPVEVSRVSATRSGRFEIALASGERLRSRRVVFATGLSHLEYTPDVLAGVSPDFVTHTAFIPDYARFRGQSVAVLGAGASAIEAGALVQESGGQAQIFVREPEVVFHGKMERYRPLHQRIRHPLSVIGVGMQNRMLQFAPMAVRLMPERQRIQFVRSYLGPAAPWWIKERASRVPMFTRTSVVAAERVQSRVRLRLRDEGGERSVEVDHVIAGTGYVPNVDRLAYLDEDLRRRLRRLEFGPALSVNFESSVAGAYFLGPVSAMSFGPLFRFVCGAAYAAPAVARHLAGPLRTAKTTVRRWTGKEEAVPPPSPPPAP
jgi:cation diffusion facilitator CzcD-associated flavoprotein CzcO